MSSGNVGGSTVVERNLDRLTVALSILFAISTFTLTWLLAS
jgi:preprotein translocase subunit SecG